MFALACLGLSGQAASAVPQSDQGLAGRVGFDQHLDRQIPLDLQFVDEHDRRVRLGDYLDAAPAALVFAYYDCANLCPTVIHNLAQRLAGAPSAGARRLQVLVVSIDPRDKPTQAARMKAKYPGEALPGASRWHFLTGEQPAIAELTGAAGFRYSYDQRSGQYAHAAGYVLLTPGGRIASYLFGFDFTSDQLEQAIDQAGARRIAAPIERLLLLCFHHDPLTGRYSATVLSTLRALGVVTLLGLWAFWIVRRARGHRAAVPHP
jgi:protein SCO1/2